MARMNTPTGNQMRLELRDFYDGVKNVSLWSMLGWHEIRQRYRRSMLGPFWLTLSTGVMIFGLGFVYAAILKVPYVEYFPYLAAGMIFWTFISSLIVDSCQTFIANDVTIRQIKLPLTIFACRLVWRNVIILAHNAVIVVAVIAVFGKWPAPFALAWLVPGLVIVVLNGIWVGMLLGGICARFRDVPQIVSSLMQLVFFVTPIIWHRSLLPGRQRVVDWNPVYHFVELLRAPVLGQVPEPSTWIMTLSVTALGWLMTIAFMRRYRQRIAYWV
jgi:ABC-type polysaccharide/polyol phosphate export permease